MLAEFTHFASILPETYNSITGLRFYTKVSMLSADDNELGKNYTKYLLS